MKQVNHFKYVGVWVIKEERIGTREIKNCIEQDRKVIGYLNSIW